MRGGLRLVSGRCGKVRGRINIAPWRQRDERMLARAATNKNEDTFKELSLRKEMVTRLLGGGGL